MRSAPGDLDELSHGVTSPMHEESWQHESVARARVKTLRRAAAALALLFAAAALVAAGPVGASGARSHSPGIPAGARAALLKAATRIAEDHGDGRPHDVRAVRTTHYEAERILCGDCELKVVAPSAPVYVVAMRGHFNCNICKGGPPGTHFSPATVITLQFVNPRNLDDVAFGYGGPYPDLKAAGTPVLLKR